MGLGKDMLKRSVGIGFVKDMKAASQAAKDGAEMLQAKDQILEQAAELRAAQAAAAQQGMPQGIAGMPGAVPQPGPGAIAEGELEPIAGVSLQKYVEISKGLGEVGYDQSKSHEVAASRGVSAEDWDAAVAGWNERIKGNRAIGQRFNQLYMGG